MKCTATWLAIATASLLLVTGCNKRQEAEEPSAGEMEEMKRMEEKAQTDAKAKKEVKEEVEKKAE